MRRPEWVSEHGGELNVVDRFGNGISGSGDGGTGAIFPRETYNNGMCRMPVVYRTCAIGVCVRSVMYIPCP